MAQLALRMQAGQKEKGALVGVLFMERISHLAGLSNRYYNTGDANEKSEAFIQFKKAAKELIDSQDLFVELEQNLNVYCSDIMTKLKKEVPSIKKDKTKIIAMFFAGIPDIYIQAITNSVSTGSLKTLRSRLRTIIKEAHAPNEELFLSMLNQQAHNYVN